MKVSKPLLAAIAAVLIAAFVLGANWYRSRDAAEANAAANAHRDRLIRPYSISQGPADAPVTLVEFFDPECESCGAMYPIVKQLQQEFGDRLRLVIRYMPLHGNSVYAAALLEAAREQNRYWEFADIMMARQPEWASHHAPRPDLLLGYAAQAGLDVEQLQVALTNPEIRARIRQDELDGRDLDAIRTPTFFVNGKVLPRLGYAPLRDAIRAELE